MDNRAEASFEQEHGLSLWIEKKEFSILFDTGQGRAFRTNCGILQIDPAEANAVVLSHGHYDHGGNLKAALRRNNATIWLHPGALITRYSLYPNQPVKRIGLTGENSQAVSDYEPGRVQWCYGMSKIADGVFVTGPIPRITSFEGGGGHFFLDPGGATPDPISDDMALWIETEKGLVIICGCCHSGLVNTLTHIRSFTGAHIHTIMGGFHLLRAQEIQLEKTIDYLKDDPPKQIIHLHCTGERAVSVLENRFGSIVKRGSAGMHMEI